MGPFSLGYRVSECFNPKIASKNGDKILLTVDDEIITENKMLEKEIQKKVCDYAKSKNFYVRPFSSSSHNGVPDRIFIKDNQVFFVEFKKFGFKATELQKREHAKIERCGIRVFVIDSFEKGKHLIDKYEENK